MGSYRMCLIGQIIIVDWYWIHINELLCAQRYEFYTLPTEFESLSFETVTIYFLFVPQVFNSKWRRPCLQRKQPSNNQLNVNLAANKRPPSTHISMFSQRKISSISKLTFHVVCWSTFASERFRSELDSYFFSHLFIIDLQYLRSQKVIKAYTVYTAFLWLLHYAFFYYVISMNRFNYCRIHPCNSLGTLKTRLPYQNSPGMKLWVTGHSISQWSGPLMLV